ncbi:MAG: hypothetical protein ACK4NR_04995 [Micavibrio sp.]
MAETATQDDSGVLFKTSIFGLELEYTKTDAAIDAGLVAAGTLVPGAGNAAMAGVAVVRSGAMMIGRGIMRSLFKKAATEGSEFVAKTALKETAEVAATKTAQEAVKKTTLSTANEDALAALVKAKAAGEAERAGVKAVTREATEEAAEAGVKTAAGAAGTKVTEEAVEATSKSLLSRTGSVALDATKFTGKVAWNTTTFGFRHPILTLGGIGIANSYLDGAIGNVVWPVLGTAGSAVKTVAPELVEGAVDMSLSAGDGITKFFMSGAEYGADKIGEHLPFGTPASVRAAVAGAESRLEGAREGAAGAVEAARDEMDDMGAELGPFRDMIAGQLGVDPKQINGKNAARMMADFAGDNKLALGMGALAAFTAEGGMMRKAMMGLLTTVLVVAMTPFLKPLLDAMAPAIDSLKQNMKDKLDQSTNKGQFNAASHGLTAPESAGQPVTRPAPAAEAANDAPAVAAFRDNGNLMTNPVTDVRKSGILPSMYAANRDQFALTANA